MVVGTPMYVLGTWYRASSFQVSLLLLPQLTVLLSLRLLVLLSLLVCLPLLHLQLPPPQLALSALLTTCPSNTAGGSLPPVDTRPISLRPCSMRCG